MTGISLTLGDVNDTPTEPQPPQDGQPVEGQGQPVQPEPQQTGSGLKQLLQDGNQILDEGLQMYQKLQRAQALAGGGQPSQSASPDVSQGEPTGADESITRKVEVEDEGQPSEGGNGVEALLAKVDNDQVLEWSKNIVGRIHNDLRRQYDRKPTVEDLEVYLNENEDELKQLMDKGRQMLKAML